MKKKVLSILLAVCLMVGCLPVSTNAAALPEDTEGLKEFLDYFLEYSIGYLSSYDAETAQVSGWGLDNAFLSLIDLHPYDDSIYPGEAQQRIDPYLEPDDTFDWSSDWSLIPKNPDFVPDPLGRFNSETIDGYYWRTNEAKSDWVMENIFNLSQENISRLKSEVNPERCYCHEGYIYSYGIRYGSGPSGFAISHVKQDGNLFYVTYDMRYWGHKFFVVEPKTIDGSVYWTLHKVITMDRDTDGVLTLPEGFDREAFGYEDPVLPPNLVGRGVCGDDTSYTLDRDGVLTISGQGTIADNYFLMEGAKNIVIEEGITTIGESAFQVETQIPISITIPTSVTHIGEWAFSAYGDSQSIDVYYSGTKEQWEKISIGEHNELLLNARMHFAKESEAPAPAPLTGSTEELQHFLKNYWYRLGYSAFDANVPTLSNGSILYFFLCNQPYDDSIYPGENAKRYEPYTWSEANLKYIRNDDYIPDPEGKCTGEEGTHYTKTNEEKFDWIMENIFNISPEDISHMKAELPNYYEDRYCYLNNGYYYVIDGADSWVSRNIVIEDVSPKGDLLYVRAADAVGKYYVVVEAKTLNGNTYWTLHYFASGTWDYIPAGLPSDFDLRVSALPPDILFAGKCGTASSYTMNHDVLTIFGSGEIADEFFSSVSAKSVIIDEGITAIGVGTFEDNWDTATYPSLNDVTIPKSVTDIKYRAFYDCRNLTDVYYNGTKEQWQKISIGEENEPLLNATIHFAKQTEPPTPTPTPEPTPTPTPTPRPTPTPTPTPSPTPSPTPIPVPTGPVTKTDTAPDGTMTTTTTWPDGKTSVKAQTPQGDTQLTVSNGAGQTVADISIPGNPGPAKQFTDVQSGWYKESIDKASALGLFSGTGPNTFSPNTPMTRGMVATVLYRLSGEVGYGLGTGNFLDVANGSWYKDAVDWAQATEVVTGTGNGFQPNKDVTREELVTMLYRYAQLTGTDSGKSVNIAGYADSGLVSAYAKDAMQWAVAEGIITGTGNNQLSPQGKATRAQVAAILTRFIDRLTQ